MVQRVILGGGLTGLTTAYLLAKRLGPDGARKLTLIEKGSRLGGWVDSRPRKAYLPNLIGNNKSKGEEIEVILESGPRSIRPRGGVGAARMLRIVSIFFPISEHRVPNLEGSSCRNNDRRYKSLTSNLRYYQSLSTNQPPKTDSSWTLQPPD